MNVFEAFALEHSRYREASDFLDVSGRAVLGF